MRSRWTGVLLTFAAAAVCHAAGNEVAPRGCTVLSISDGIEVFFAGNDDYHTPHKTYWVDPGRDGAYGAIYFGDPDNIQQGFNEAGLAYDANGLPSLRVTAHDGTLPGPGRYSWYPIEILKECATVDEVIQWAESHVWHAAMHDQMHFADASGGAVVLSVGSTGRLTYTRKPAGDSFLVSTNFNVAVPENGDYPSWRYDLATNRASELLGSHSVSRDQVASIMKAVHVETRRNYTVYTVVADLVQGQVSVYRLFQYDEPIVIDIRAELARGSGVMALRDLFPTSTVERGEAALDRLDAPSRTWRAIGIAWAASVMLSIAFWVVSPRTRTRGLTSLYTVMVLGPIGLLIGLVTVSVAGVRTDGLGERSRSLNTWMASLVGAGRDAASIIVPVSAGVLLWLLVPAIENSPWSPLLLIILAPVAFAWLVVRAPGLASSANIGYVHAVARSAAPTIFSTSLLMATTLPFVLPLALWLPARGVSLWAIAFAVWVFGVVFSLPGSCLLIVFHRFSGHSQHEIGLRRIGVGAILIVVAAVLLVAALYLASQTVTWFGPLIEGARFGAAGL